MPSTPWSKFNEQQKLRFDFLNFSSLCVWIFDPFNLTHWRTCSVQFSTPSDASSCLEVVWHNWSKLTCCAYLMGQGDTRDYSQIPLFLIREDTYLCVCYLSIHQLSKTSGNPVIIRTLTPLSKWVKLQKWMCSNALHLQQAHTH